jgi:biotin transport system substrate-specific component
MRDIIAVVIGSLTLYGCGVPWLKIVTEMSWSKALWVGAIPFLLGDTIKASVAVILTRSVRPMLDRLSQSSSFRSHE